jgi:type IV pilus assembly protein PilC
MEGNNNNMEFVFKAKDQNGNFKEGKVEAINKDSAVALIQGKGLIPVSVSQEEQGSDLVKELNKILEGVSQKELVIFFQELAILIDAKVPLVPALLALEEQIDNRFLKIIIHEIRGDVEDGMPFSEAMMKHPDVFSTLEINMMRSGEISGNLQKSIGYIAENTEKNYQLTSKIKSALYYPIFVMVVAAIIGFVVITFILPKITVMIKDMKIEVPWYTTAIMWTGDFMQNYWWAVLVLVFGVLGGIAYYIRTEEGHKEWDKIKLKIPVVGELLRFVYMARFADNLSILMDGGIPIVRSMIIVSEVIDNSVFQSIMLRAADEVKSGRSISSVFEKSVDIPPIVTRMVKVGEESGKMSEILRKVATFYDQEVDRMTRNLTTLIEPILIVILGIGVAILSFGVLLPIYDIAGKI